MKNRVYSIVFLLIVWCGFSNNFQPANMALGLLFSLTINYLVIPKSPDFSINVWQLLLLCFYMLWELSQSSIKVAWEILTPTHKSQSELIRLPLKCYHPVQISLLISLISLTPGTLAVDVEKNNEWLVIHIMFAQNKQKIIDAIQDRLTTKIMKVIVHD